MSKVKKKVNDENNSKFFVCALIGAILIGVLIVLQLTFTEYMQFANSGLAVKSGTVGKFLSINPMEEEPEKNVGMYNFKAAEFLYKHNSNLFFNSDKKVQMDANFPVYLNHGASLQTVNAEAVLFDENYERVETYKGLIISKAMTYNPSGTKASADKYVMLELKNGYFMNLMPITYTKKKSDKKINEHSIINFNEEFFAFYELENDELVYKYCTDIDDNMLVGINGKEYTYKEFLVLIGVTKDKDQQDEDESEEETSSEVENESGETTTKETEETTEEESEETTTETEKDTEEDKTEEDTTQEYTTEFTTEKETEEEPEETTTEKQDSPGVRPDELRPDKDTDEDDDDDKKPAIPEYVKPTVEVGDFVAGVYRVTTELKIYDPAKRIDKTKQVQFEVYKVGNKGKETLAMRCYSGKNGPMIIGDGIIEPDTKYHIVYYFTYYNEFDEKVVEDLGDCFVTTKGMDTLGAIYLTHKPGTSYSNHIELEDVGFGEESDEEAVYGINVASGITITISKNGEKVSYIKFNSTQIRRFKTGVKQLISSLSNLSARTTYQYDFYVEDYFGNELEIINSHGEVTTSRNTPIAMINLIKNEIGNAIFEVSIEDPDASAIVKDVNQNGIYAVITEDAKDLESVNDIKNSVWSYKLSQGEYTYSESEGLVVNQLELPAIDNLKLNKNYYISVYCDYDLDNGKGVQKFKPIGKLRFTSASLAVLGKVYMDCKVTDVTCNTATIEYNLNTKLTNPELVGLIKECKLTVKDKADDSYVTEFGFTKDDKTEDGRYVYELFRNGETLVYTIENLDSVTEYYLEPSIKAYYLDYEEDIVVAMNKVMFKTLRKPATVEIEDLLFAAGTLEFNVYVNDEDGAVTGNSGDFVVVNLYVEGGEYVKAIRITKNEMHTIKFTQLDASKNYNMRFIAVEYNEGYTNATLKSNVVLKSVDVSTMLDVSGNIKLQHIDEIYDSPQYMAYTKSQISVSGPEDLAIIKGKFYIRIEKDGVPISDKDAEYLLEDKNLQNGLYVNNFRDSVDVGQHTYKYTLYVIAENREFVLDTLEFTTETTVKGFSTAYELITLMQADPDGKYVAINDIVLYSSNNYKYPNEKNDEDKGPSVSGVKVVTTFEGELDFQGYKLTHHYEEGSSQQFIQNFGAGAKLHDVVYDVYFDREASVYDAGIWSYRNYGTISDIIINYRGGNVVANSYCGILARYNASCGVIERFVVNNVPDEDKQPFAAYVYTGMVIGTNDGIIRNGYAAGEDIYLTQATKAIARYCGGIVGTSNSLGQIENVYSLVNFVQDEKGNSGYSISHYYGSVSGFVGGYFHNAYSIGESTPSEFKNDTTIPDTEDAYGIQISPTVGQISNGRCGDLYYWFDMHSSMSNGSTYKTNYLKMVLLDTLYNRSWQTSILGEQFETDYVEIGYFPKVIMSSEMPFQTNIPLPERIEDNELGVSTAVVEKYINDDNGTDSAEIKIVFLNKKNYTITDVQIDNVTVKLDLDSAKSQDGYTTMTGKVTNPETFTSSYKIKEIAYLRNNRTMRMSVDYDMSMEFYRHVATPDDWYQYVVLNTRNGIVENVRLTKDIDFSKTDTTKIRVPKPFNAKINGNGKTIKNIDLQKDFAVTNNTTIWNLFSDQVGASAEIKNLTIENYKCGGMNVKGGKTYVARYAGVFYHVSGVIEDVHVNGCDIIGYDRTGGLTANLSNGSEVKDSSVSSVNINYVQPTNVESTICVGGLAGYITYARVKNCYVTDVNITAENLKGSQGVGGVIGYSTNSIIESVYATGNIETRASNVGGIVGQYITTSVSIVCIKDVVAKVNIRSYTEAIGGIVGLLNIPPDIINTTDNTSGISSGVSFGNVYAYNPDTEYVSRTVGQIVAGKLMFHASDVQLLNGQLLNGQANATLTENEKICTYDIVTVKALNEDATNMYLNVIKLGDSYKYASDGNLPKLYRDGKKELVRYQKDIKLQDENVSGFNITTVNVNTNSRVITVRILNPNHYLITDLGIKNLDVNYVKQVNGTYVSCSIEEAIDYTNDVTMVLMQYKNQQQHYQDSYVIEEISYYNKKESCYSGISVGSALSDSKNIVKGEVFARVGLTMYREINSIEQWSRIKQYPEYENYAITQDIDFKDYADYATELKIGRLVGNGYTLSNIKLENESLIQQVSSLVKDINFEGVRLESNGSTNVGIIKISTGKISNCSFKNITINNTYKSTVTEVGIISRQNGGSINNITLEDIKVKASSSKGTYLGGFIGYYYGVGDMRDVTAKKIDVVGIQYVGGIAGRILIADVENVSIENSSVIGSSSYVGGIAGYLGENSNSRVYAVSNVSIKGEPEYVDGKLVGSDFIVSGTGEVGGIAGRSYLSDCYRDGKSDSKSNNIVDGIYVKGKANNIGGAYGYHYYNAYYITVENTFVEAISKTSQNNVGGIVGNDAYSGGYHSGKNNRIYTQNYSNVGGLIGQKERSTINHNYCENTTIEATSTSDIKNSNVGGALGNTTYSSAYSTSVINTKVIAPKLDNVGGIIGHMGISISNNYVLSRSFAIAETDSSKIGTEEAAVAKPEYVVEGYANVGGIVGNLNGSNITYSYSNMNVVAKGGAQAIAGGLTGYYNNSYLKVNNTNVKTYSNAKLQMNYFAGSVSAVGGYAGGAFGVSGLHNEYNVSGGRVAGVTGNVNEASGNLTYRNLIFASKIEGASAGAFAGDEGLTFVGRTNRVFDGVKVNSVYVDQMTDREGNYLYSYWKWDGITWHWNSPHSDDAIYIFKDSDIEEAGITNTVSTASSFYAQISWGARYTGGKTLRNTYWRISLDGRTDANDAGGVCVGNFLPQIRSTNAEKSVYKNDLSIKKQEIVGRLNIPQHTSFVRVDGYISPQTSTMTQSIGDIENESYAILYVSDVDKVNVEFSADMIGSKYFKLTTEDGAVIDEGTIKKRVYSYTYPFNENLVLTYGIEGEEMTSDTYAREEINRNIMVYGDYYYYFYAEGLVYGNESSVQSVVDKFVNVMNGKALDSDGYIWKMSNGKMTKTENKTEAIELLEETVPLFTSNYNNKEIKTFAKCSEIISGGSSIIREAQLVVKNNSIYNVDGKLLNQKDGMLIFKKNGVEYMTILGEDHIMVDMFNSEVILPVDDEHGIKNESIVLITNSINANVPFAIIKYANGGMLGYNYMTEEILFDMRIKDQVSILDYAEKYFSGAAVSMYAGICNSYEENYILSNKLENPSELDELISNSAEGSYDIYSETGSDIAEGDMPGVSNKETEPFGNPETEKEEETTLNDALNDKKFMVAYDADKEGYSIISVDEYLDNSDYKSENDRLGVDNLAEVIKGKPAIAGSVKDSQGQSGIWLYVIVVIMLMGGIAAFVPVIRKNLRFRRK